MSTKGNQSEVDFMIFLYIFLTLFFLSFNQNEGGPWENRYYCLLTFERNGQSAGLWDVCPGR